MYTSDSMIQQGPKLMDKLTDLPVSQFSESAIDFVQSGLLSTWFCCILSSLLKRNICVAECVCKRLGPLPTGTTNIHTHTIHCRHSVIAC